MRFEVYKEALTFFELTARIYESYFITERLGASTLENSPEKFFNTLEKLREKLRSLKLLKQEEESWLKKTEHMQHIHFRAFESWKKMLSATSHGSTATEIAMSDKLMLFFLRDDITLLHEVRTMLDESIKATSAAAEAQLRHEEILNQFFAEAAMEGYDVFGE